MEILFKCEGDKFKIGGYSYNPVVYSSICFVHLKGDMHRWNFVFYCRLCLHDLNVSKHK